MTARRLDHSATKTPALTRGHDDAPRPACDGDWLPFYNLIDHPGSQHARKECLDICDGCPIKAACWNNNADEEWVQALREGVTPRRICRVPLCHGTHSAKGMCAMHYERARRRQEVA